MRKSYHFAVSGSGAEGQTFHCLGEVLCEFSEVFDAAMTESFRQLTNGRAIYGSPGVGCRGPYDIQSVSIEQVNQ
jgi:hypothetical protein